MRIDPPCPPFRGDSVDQHPFARALDACGCARVPTDRFAGLHLTGMTTRSPRRRQARQAAIARAMLIA
jgi:hypothetical protein